MNTITRYRLAAVRVRGADGSATTDLRYAGHEIGGSASFSGALPHVREAQETETLRVFLRDPVKGVKAMLRRGRQV